MPTSRRASDSGFTLMEMLVVLVIAGLAAALLAGKLSEEPSRITRQRLVAELEARIATGRRQAIRTGAPTQLMTSEFDEGATLEAPVFGDGRALIFYPDGSSTGGTIALAGEPVLTIDWLTGEALDAD